MARVGVGVRVRAVLAALLAVGAVVAGFAQPASASNGGCTYGGKPVDRCVYVNGSSTWVNYIEGTIRYKTGLGLEIEVWGDGIYYRGRGSNTTPSDTTYVKLTINRNLADRSYVCVAARWTDESTPDQRAAAVEALRRLGEEVSGLGHLQVGTDAGLAPGNADCVVTVDFATRDDYLAYAAHPGHLDVIARFLRPIIAERTAVQHDS